MFALDAFAQGTEAVPQQAGSPYNFFFMMILIFIIFYFILIRPERQKQRKHQEKINALKKGDRIVTAGGIYGSIVGMKDEIAVIKIAENVKIEILKSAISTIVEEGEKKG